VRKDLERSGMGEEWRGRMQKSGEGCRRFEKNRAEHGRRSESSRVLCVDTGNGCVWGGARISPSGAPSMCTLLSPADCARSPCTLPDSRGEASGMSQWTCTHKVTAPIPEGLSNSACFQVEAIELSVKSSKESTERVSLLKTGNKVVEVG
jgi:hypothetical protein